MVIGLNDFGEKGSSGLRFAVLTLLLSCIGVFQIAKCWDFDSTPGELAFQADSCLMSKLL
ncbi:MAG: hypothetical protein DMG91_09650 [Acidobacteria bacterium]|nr:MAG: hypothetical protein DMG91_09650 [Acidobacteriota bacterium]